MKTNQELQNEALRLMVLGRQYREEHRRAHVGVSDTSVAAPRVLAHLPESRVTTAHEAEPESESVHTHRRERYIEAGMEADELVFRLMEQETEATGSGRVVREGAAFLVMVSESVFDPLRAGYDLIEEERLGESLAPYAERGEDRRDDECVDGEAVAEVEAILETDLLPVADRLRTKVEITEFLEGRLEPSVFIAHAVERQCWRDCRREQIAERNENKLTIDEP